MQSVQFIPLTQSFKINLNLAQSFFDNKHIIFSFILEKSKILKELNNNIAIELQKIKQNGTNSSEAYFLEQIMQKISTKIHFLMEEEEENDNIELQNREINFILNSMQYILNGKILSDEDLPLTNSSLEKGTTIQILFNLKKGLEMINSNERVDENEENTFLNCHRHKKEKSSLFCLNCQKLICSLDVSSAGSFFLIVFFLHAKNSQTLFQYR